MSYNVDSIKILKGLEGVRHRPTMYLGERGHPMIFRMLKEIVDNSVDEALAGRNSYIEVVVNTKTNEYLVADAGQGIPVGLNKKEGINTLTAVFTMLHAGGKFDSKAYSVSSGVHGVGAACTNACSTKFSVWTYNKKWYHQSFSLGKPTTEVTKQNPPSSITSRLKKNPASGTVVYFTPDQSVVSADKKEVAKLQFKETLHWLRMLALLNSGVRINIRNEVTDKSYSYFNKHGIITLLKKKLVDLKLVSLAKKPFVLENDKIDVTFTWTDYSEDDGMVSYVNCSPTRDNGKHMDGFYAAIFKAINVHKKKKEKFTLKDLRIGLVGYLNWRMTGADFSSQTKDRLTSDIGKQVESILAQPLLAYFAKHKKVARLVIKRAIEISQSREQFKKVMESVSKIKKQAKGTLLPNVLTVASKATPANRELFCCEGESAGGSAKKARDSNYQEVLTLGGKPANAQRMKLSKLLTSVPIQNILIALGVDINSLSKDGSKIVTTGLRIKDFFVMADSDVDGYHISVLILTLLHRFLPDLFKEGRVWVVDAPLYHSFFKNKHYFGSTFNECYEQMPKGAPKQLVIRAKGLGEVSAEVLAHIAFNPKTRSVVKILPPKGADIKYFEALVGENTAVRKKLLGL